jgi:hypothetical protein
MHRPLAAACAGLATCVSLYPLEVVKTLQHSGIATVPTHPYSGVRLDAASTFAGTWLYFETYEALLPLGTIVAPTAAVVTSSLISAPSSLCVRRIQLTRNSDTRLPRLQSGSLARTYFVTIARSVPRAIIKYSFYEFFLRLLATHNVYGALGGLMSGALASAISSVSLAPLDYAKTCIASGRPFRIEECLNGIKVSTLLTVLSNAFGHAILETLGAR